MDDSEIIKGLEDQLKTRQDLAREMNVDYVNLTKVMAGAVPMGPKMRKRAEEYLALRDERLNDSQPSKAETSH